MERLDSLLTIPALPALARRIVGVVCDPDVALERVVDTVEHSPEITARLLGLANSAYYAGGGRAVTNLGDAVIRVLGLETTRSLALAFSLASVFDARRCRRFDTARHWRNALMTADLAQRFAHHLKSSDRPSLATAYTAGLLANLGVMALAHALPVELDRALEASQAASLSLSEALHEVLGFDHHGAGGRLAYTWRLASTLGVAMTHHHDLDYTGEDWPLVVVVGAAARYADPGLERAVHGRDSDEGLVRLGIGRSWRDTAIAECARRRETLAALGGEFS